MKFDGILPIGTLVSFKDEEDVYMIAAYALQDKDTGDLYDYGCYPYPEGCSLGINHCLMVNHDQINLVYTLGYEDDISKIVRSRLDTAIKKTKSFEDKRGADLEGVSADDIADNRDVIDKFLPLGSVLELIDGNVVMVSGYMPYKDSSDDYFCCDFRTGLLTERSIAFSRKSIKEVISIGNINKIMLDYEILMNSLIDTKRSELVKGLLELEKLEEMEE